MSLKVRVEGVEVSIEKGQSLLEAIRKAGIRITSPCGGKGVCGKCLIKLSTRTSNIDPTSIERSLLEEDDLREGYRLACRVFPEEEVSLSIPEESREMTLELLLKHATMKEIEVAALTAERSNVAFESKEEILKFISGNGIENPNNVLTEIELNELIGKKDIMLWFDDGKLTSMSSGDKRKIGVAMDIGSTTMVVYGFDIIDQRIVSAEAMTNPQRQYGEDVMTRIDFSMKSQEQKHLLEKVVRAGASELIAKLSAKCGATPHDVIRVTFVGNTAMHHLFLGLDVTRLGRVPFSPETKEPIEVRGSDVALKGMEKAKVNAPPLIAGFVGADLVAVLLATDLVNSKAPTGAIDIGTNAEIALASNGRLLCCSSAAGPAFEGGNISHGMRATDGAISRIWSEAGILKYDTIGGAEPIGLCGSGLIDFVSEGLRLGLIDSAGGFVAENCGDKLVGRHGIARYLLHSSGRREVSVSQGDIRQLQLAKAAMHAGLEILMDKAGVKKLDRLLLAGAFGANMSTRNGRFIGMFPEIPLSEIVPVGNAAGTGAIQLLADKKAREKIGGIAKKAEHIELSLERDFQKRFIAAIDYPHQDFTKYPESARLVKIKVQRGR